MIAGDSRREGKDTDIAAGVAEDEFGDAGPAHLEGVHADDFCAAVVEHSREGREVDLSRVVVGHDGVVVHREQDESALLPHL